MAFEDDEAGRGDDPVIELETFHIEHDGKLVFAAVLCHTGGTIPWTVQFCDGNCHTGDQLTSGHFTDWTRNLCNRYGFDKERGARALFSAMSSVDGRALWVKNRRSDSNIHNLIHWYLEQVCYQ